MAEVEVNYASVVFKSNKLAPPEAEKEKETVYAEVKAKNKPTEQTADANAGFLPDKKANNRRRRYQQLACCLGILCVILLLALIAVCYFLATLNQLDDNLRREHDNLTVQLGNLTQNVTVLGSKITNLTTQNHQLETEKNNLTEQIQNMTTNWNELNVSRAQWTIDAYCPIKDNKRKCNACQEGWTFNKSSCYVIHNGPPPEQITWKQARNNCRVNNAELAVVHNQQEKDIINYYSWDTPKGSAYWIGLRVEDGKWKWIDGTELTQTSRIGRPTEGLCAVSIKNEKWKSVSCGDRNRWICTKKALSV